MSNRTRTGTRSECHFSSGLGNHTAACCMHLTVTLMQFDLVTCRAPSHHPETPGREIHRQMDWIWISSSSSMQTCSGFDSDQASSSSKARTSYRGRPATVRQAGQSPRAGKVAWLL